MLAEQPCSLRCHWQCEIASLLFFSKGQCFITLFYDISGDLRLRRGHKNHGKPDMSCRADVAVLYFDVGALKKFGLCTVFLTATGA